MNLAKERGVLSGRLSLSRATQRISISFYPRGKLLLGITPPWWRIACPHSNTGWGDDRHDHTESDLHGFEAAAGPDLQERGSSELAMMSSLLEIGGALDAPALQVH